MLASTINGAGMGFEFGPESRESLPRPFGSEQEGRCSNTAVGPEANKAVGQATSGQGPPNARNNHSFHSLKTSALETILPNASLYR